jgi:hypothetical protein
LLLAPTQGWRRLLSSRLTLFAAHEEEAAAALTRLLLLSLKLE